MNNISLYSCIKHPNIDSKTTQFWQFFQIDCPDIFKSKFGSRTKIIFLRVCPPPYHCYQLWPPGWPRWTLATWRHSGPQGRHEEGGSPVPGRKSRPIHLALARKVVGYQILYLLWNIWNIKYYLWDPVSLSPVSGLTTLPLLQAVEPSLCVNLPVIQAHHQIILDQLVQYKIWKPSLKVTNTQHQPPATMKKNR